jgi:TonB family protein
MLLAVFVPGSAHPTDRIPESTRKNPGFVLVYTAPRRSAPPAPKTDARAQKARARRPFVAPPSARRPASEVAASQPQEIALPVSKALQNGTPDGLLPPMPPTPRPAVLEASVLGYDDKQALGRGGYRPAAGRGDLLVGVRAGSGDGRGRPGRGVGPAGPLLAPTGPSPAPKSGSARRASGGSTPVEIFFPRPEYTAEARALKIRGSVLIRAMFYADGHSIEILGLPQTLGHGLDEAAVEAVRLAKFKPATVDGRPVDRDIVLMVSFDLAE